MYFHTMVKLNRSKLQAKSVISKCIKRKFKTSPTIQARVKPTVYDHSYLYILTNPSFKEKYIKIGMCTDIESRIGILNSSVYKKFKVHTLFETIFKNKKSGKNVTCSNITKQIETYLHKRFDHLRADNGEFFLVDPCIVRDELQFIHDKVAPYVDTDASMVSEYMDLHIECARLQSLEDEIDLS